MNNELRQDEKQLNKKNMVGEKDQFSNEFDFKVKIKMGKMN